MTPHAILFSILFLSAACWYYSWTPCLLLFPSSFPCINDWAQENNYNHFLHLHVITFRCLLSTCCHHHTFFHQIYLTSKLLDSCNATTFTSYLFKSFIIRSTFLSSPLFFHLLATSVGPSVCIIELTLHAPILPLIYVQNDFFPRSFQNLCSKSNQLWTIMCLISQLSRFAS